jgi:hypothetical protein
MLWQGLTSNSKLSMAVHSPEVDAERRGAVVFWLLPALDAAAGLWPCWLPPQLGSLKDSFGLLPSSSMIVKRPFVLILRGLEPCTHLQMLCTASSHKFTCDEKANCWAQNQGLQLRGVPLEKAAQHGCVLQDEARLPGGSLRPVHVSSTCCLASNVHTGHLPSSGTLL